MKTYPYLELEDIQACLEYAALLADVQMFRLIRFQPITLVAGLTKNYAAFSKMK